MKMYIALRPSGPTTLSHHVRALPSLHECCTLPIHVSRTCADAFFLSQEIPQDTVIVTETETATKFVTAGPAPTRVAARPTPEKFVTSATASDSGKTREVFVEIVTEIPEPTTVVETVKVPRRRKWLRNDA